MRNGTRKDRCRTRRRRGPPGLGLPAGSRRTSGTGPALRGASVALTAILSPAAAGHRGAVPCQLVSRSEPSLEGLLCTQTRYRGEREGETERDRGAHSARPPGRQGRRINEEPSSRTRQVPCTSLSEKAEAGGEGDGTQGPSECRGRSFKASPQPRLYPGWAGPRGSPPQGTPLITEDLRGVRRGCPLAGHTGHGARGTVDGTDRNGKLHCHLAFRSICSRLSPWLPTGTNPSALDSSKGVL